MYANEGNNREKCIKNSCSEERVVEYNFSTCTEDERDRKNGEVKKIVLEYYSDFGS
jgi:hypothetical protein